MATLRTQHVTPRRPSLDGLDVLLIDDDRDFREVMAALLEARGATVVRASGGRKGLARAKRQHHDVVLLDQLMPDMLGTEVAECLRRQGDPAAIVIVTAKLDAPEIAEEAGVEGWLIKPFSVDELVVTIKEALRRRERSQRETRHPI